MPLAPRPDLRSQRRSRRRQFALVCGALSYLAAVSAGLLALLSLVLPIGAVVLLDLFVAGVLAIAVVVLLSIDAVRGPAHRQVPERGPPTPRAAEPAPACGTSVRSACARASAAFISSPTRSPAPCPSSASCA